MNEQYLDSSQRLRPCDWCGKPLIGVPRPAKTHPGECRLQFNRKTAREERKRQYHANPERFRAYLRSLYRKDPRKQYEAKRRWAATACTSCKKVVYKGELKKSQREGFICQSCKKWQRAAGRAATCYYCRKTIVPRWHNQNTSGKYYCEDCVGIQQKTGVELGISRERVRQLVNKEYDRHEGTLSLRECLEVVKTRRLAT